LPTLNNVLQPLTSPNVYATFAYIAGGGDSRLRFSLAGHLPIFHFKFAKQHAELCRVENLPLGVFADARYQTATIECRPGDLAAMITDGLTEVFDRKAENWAGNTWRIHLRIARANPFPRSLRALSVLPKLSVPLPTTGRFCWCAILAIRDKIFPHRHFPPSSLNY
jgi:hypothetical protein